MTQRNPPEETWMLNIWDAETLLLSNIAGIIPSVVKKTLKPIFLYTCLSVYSLFLPLQSEDHVERFWSPEYVPAVLVTLTKSFSNLNLQEQHSADARLKTINSI